jgi:hypothetical protein
MKKSMLLWMVLVALAVLVTFSIIQAQEVEIDVGIPVIITHPQDVVLGVGETHELFVKGEAKDVGELSYQWYICVNSDKSVSKPLTGSTKEVYSIKGSPKTTYYFVTVTNNLKNGMKKTTESNVATVVSGLSTLNAATPIILSSPQNVVTELNKDTELSVTATVDDGGKLSYQWLRNANVSDNSGWKSIEGAVNASFVPDVTKIGKAYYKVVVTNSNTEVIGEQIASQTSYPAEVIVTDVGVVNAKFPIVTGPSRGFEVGSENHTEMKVTAESIDGGILSYQWFKTPVKENAGGVAVDGAVSDVFDPGFNLGQLAVFYYVEVTNTNTKATGEKTAITASKAVEQSAIVTDITNGNRLIPQTNTTSEKTAILVPVKVVAGGFAVGPNPVNRNCGSVVFFHQGVRLKKTMLSIYDASGSFIKNVTIDDKTMSKQLRRQVGSWDLTDKKGRLVSEGTYLIRGELKTSNGKSENVSILLGVK